MNSAAHARSAPAALATPLATLEASLSSELLAPPDAANDRARSVWNGMIDRRPVAISRCKSVADVIASIRFAGEQGLPVSTRGSGHNVAGHAVCDGGLMIDLS